MPSVFKFIEDFNMHYKTITMINNPSLDFYHQRMQNELKRILNILLRSCRENEKMTFEIEDKTS